MNTTVTDPNAAFDTEKNRQLTAQRAARDEAIADDNRRAAWLDGEVAAGRMQRIGTDRYRVRTGWDAGEVFTVSRTVDGVAEVVAQHGLDTQADGTAALYTSQPEWHSAGHVIPGSTTSVETVLRLGGLDFEVVTVPSTYTWDGQTRTHEGQFHTVRTDTGAALGVVGSRYVPIQNADGFSFLEELTGERKLLWETAGSLNGGASVFISTRLPETITIDADGINDEIVPYLMVRNRHDGFAFEAVATPWRPRCANTERVAVRDAYTRWSVRHTAGARQRISEARRTLGFTFRYYEAFEVEENALARTDLAIDEFRAVIDVVWPMDEDPSSRQVNNAEQRADLLIAGFRSEAQELGQTAYAAERVLTNYLDFVAPRRVPKTMTDEIARAGRLIEGDDDGRKATAHRQLLLLTRR